VAQVVACLSSKHEAVSSNPSTKKKKKRIQEAFEGSGKVDRTIIISSLQFSSISTWKS
jgi:hypothetical protein